jgi:hypothetical protein
MTDKLTPEQLAHNAGLINAAHHDVVEANKTSISRAIEAGTMLRACKETVGHGGWMKWLAENCPDISEETARLYMRLADPKNVWKLEREAEQNGNAVADLSIRGAAKAIRPPQTAEQKAARAARAARAAQPASPDLGAMLENSAPDELAHVVIGKWDLTQIADLATRLNDYLIQQQQQQAA